MKKTTLILLLVCAVCAGTFAQKTAEDYFTSGNIHYENNNFDKAIADYTQAIKLNPNFAEAYYFRGNSYSYNDSDKTIADYTEAIRLNPRYVNAYFSRGNAYFWNKDYDKAIADFEAVLKIEPNNAEARKALENAKQARGN
jgi:tetratricopeptide (TPR) repeat protein